MLAGAALVYAGFAARCRVDGAAGAVLFEGGAPLRFGGLLVEAVGFPGECGQSAPCSMWSMVARSAVRASSIWVC